MRPSFSFSRSPCLSLSLSNLFHLVPSSYPVSLFFTPSSSLLVSRSLLRKRLVSSSSRFPSLPSPHAAIAATAAATTHRRRAPLSGFARSSSSHPPPLFIFLQPSGLLVALSVHRTYTHTLRHSYMYIHTNIVFSCVSLSPTIFPSPSSPFLNPCSRPSVSASRSSSSASLLSHPCPENPPFPTHRTSLQKRPASTSHTVVPPVSPQASLLLLLLPG